MQGCCAVKFCNREPRFAVTRADGLADSFCAEHAARLRALQRRDDLNEQQAAVVERYPFAPVWELA